MLDHASVGAGSDYPNVGGVDHFNQALFESLFQLWLQTKVGDTTVNGYDELGELQLPVVFYQVDNVLGFCIER